MSLRRKAVVAAMTTVLSGASVAPALAQMPPDLRDLVGARAGQAELELQRRGYSSVKTQEGGSAKWTYWRRRDDCVQVTTRDGRYLTIVKASRNDCNIRNSTSTSTSAVVAGVAIIGLAAALAAHKRDHENAGRDHDADYDRGYRAGYSGYSYDDRRDSEGYHEGFVAGEGERDNRRYADTPWVSSAPQAARNACASRADAFQSRPSGSSVPIGVRELGRGDYELTMATGPYRSRCVVSSYGVVRSMNPY